MISLAIVFEEIATVWMGLAGVLGSHSLACRMIAKHGTDAQKQQYLPEFATGERRTGFALTEPGAGTDLQGIQTRAWRDGDHYVVRGTKLWITNARHANPLPVLVKTDPSAEPAHRGMSMLLIEQGLPGFTVSRDMGKLGYKGPETCEVSLDDVRVPVDCLLGGVEGRGMQQALSALECGRINIAARAVGVAAAALNAALRYTSERHAFGSRRGLPSGADAARRHGFVSSGRSTADLLGRRQARYAAARTPRRRWRSCSRSETALSCAVDSMRLHGAMGYSTELDVERYYRDAPLMAIGEGTNDVLRTVIAAGLLRELEPA